MWAKALVNQKQKPEKRLKFGCREKARNVLICIAMAFAVTVFVFCPGPSQPLVPQIDRSIRLPCLCLENNAHTECSLVVVEASVTSTVGIYWWVAHCRSLLTATVDAKMVARI